MAKWRVKAYEMFGFVPGSYSYETGPVQLFADLLVKARFAASEGDDAALCRIFEYVRWAAGLKNADRLASAVDLAFFLPAFRDREMREVLLSRLPLDLCVEKWRMLMEEPEFPGTAVLP